jgi:hypothetical protein
VEIADRLERDARDYVCIRFWRWPIAGLAVLVSLELIKRSFAPLQNVRSAAD